MHLTLHLTLPKRKQYLHWHKPPEHAQENSAFLSGMPCAESHGPEIGAVVRLFAAVLIPGKGAVIVRVEATFIKLLPACRKSPAHPVHAAIPEEIAHILTVIVRIRIKRAGTCKQDFLQLLF